MAAAAAANHLHNYNSSAFFPNKKKIMHLLLPTFLFLLLLLLLIFTTFTAHDLHHNIKLYTASSSSSDNVEYGYDNITTAARLHRHDQYMNNILNPHVNHLQQLQLHPTTTYTTSANTDHEQFSHPHRHLRAHRLLEPSTYTRVLSTDTSREESIFEETEVNVAAAVKDWAGLNGTHIHPILDALSFYAATMHNSSSLQQALFSPPHPAGSQPMTVSVDFRVSRLFMKNGNSNIIHVQGSLILRQQYSPAYWNYSGSHRLSVAVQGQLSVENRELSINPLCLNVVNQSDYKRQYLSEAVIKDCKIKMTVKYPEARSILTPVSEATIESLKAPSDPLYFHPTKFYGRFRGSYAYSKIPDSQKVCDASSVALVPEAHAYRGVKICEVLQLMREFRVGRSEDCNSGACGPFAVKVNDTAAGWRPKLLLFDLMDCGDQNGQMNGFLSLDALGDDVLAVEGVWSPSAGRVCLMACHSPGNFLEADCSIQVQIQIARTISLQQRSVLFGQVASLKSTSDPHFFKPLGFQAAFRRYILQHTQPLLNLSYNYTRLEQVEDCRRKNAAKRSNLQGKYPDMYIEDLEFYGEFKIQKQHIMRAFFSILTVGDLFRPTVIEANSLAPQTAVEHIRASPKSLPFHSTSNISLSIGMRTPKNLQPTLKLWYSDISAEGIYDANSGNMCLIGCRMVNIPEKGIKEQEDCKILIEIHYPPVEYSALRHSLSGTISSLRNKTDPLYFEPIKIVSAVNYLYIDQAHNALSRRDVELFLSMTTLSITAIVVFLQLSYTKAHPETARYMSLVMLVILTLNPMIPLVLNFEATLSASAKRSLLYLSGGWIELKEVVIRIITMALFLLQLYLLQFAWAARRSAILNQGQSIERELSERKVLKICLPVYLLGAILAIFLQWLLSYSALEAYFLWNDVQLVWWAALKGYGGVIIDFFLLPQVIANFLWGSQGKTLSSIFYAGMTCLRSLPHIYDVYRAHKFFPQHSIDYFYAAPESSYFSLIWDILIPCGGLLLAVAIFLQQKFGGRCIVQPKWGGNPMYQKI